MDDGAGCEKDFASTQSCSDTVRSDLVKAGLVANCDKSIWIPTQCLDWLGISWDLLNATLTIPQPRVDRLLSALGVFKDKLGTLRYTTASCYYGNFGREGLG